MFSLPLHAVDFVHSASSSCDRTLYLPSPIPRTLFLSLSVSLSLSLPFALALDDKSRRRVTHTSARGECRFVSFAFAPLPVRLFSFTCSSSWRPRGKKKTTSRSPRRIRVREFHFLRAMTLPVVRDCLVDFSMIV